MPAEKSQLLSGMGKSFELLRLIINSVLEQGGNDSDISRLLTVPYLKGEVAEVFIRAKQALEPFLSHVNYKDPLHFKDREQVISFCSPDHINPAYRFSRQLGEQRRTVESRWFYFIGNQDLTMSEIEAKMAEDGYRIGCQMELTHEAGIAYCNFPSSVIGAGFALGTTWQFDGKVHVPCCRQVYGLEIFLAEGCTTETIKERKWPTGKVVFLGVKEEAVEKAINPEEI